MGKSIAVTPERLEAVAAKIESMASDYKTQYQSLYSETDALQATYKGEDSQKFHDQIEGFKPDLEKMMQLMNQYAEFLRTSAKSYRETMNANMERAARLAN